MHTPGRHNLLNTYTAVPRAPAPADPRQEITEFFPMTIHLDDGDVEAAVVPYEDENGRPRAVLEAHSQPATEELKQVLGSVVMSSISGGEVLSESGGSASFSPAEYTVLPERILRDDGSSTPVLRTVRLSD